jgi:parallel beta-helix repeat protein
MAPSNWLRSLRDTRERFSVRKIRPTRKLLLGRKLSLELLEDRTLLSPVLTVTNLTVSGSNGAIVSNSGTWFDDPGLTLSLTASAGNVMRNTDGTWSWSFTTPTTGTASQAVTITGDDGSGYKAFATFYLNPNLRTVRNTNDSGADSLRQAIIDTNNDKTGVDEIVFALTGTGPFTIQPATPLDPITTPVFINGYSQPGSSANNMPNQGLGAGDNAAQFIALDGSTLTGGGTINLGSYANLADADAAFVAATAAAPSGLVIAGANSAVRGLVIQNFSATYLAFFPGFAIYGKAGTAIHLLSGGNTIAGNYLTNTAGGVSVDNVPNNLIGGSSPADRNIIESSIGISGVGASGNQVQGDYIGTDGIQVLGGGLGIGASNNVVGGTAPGSGNVIASGSDGINIAASGNLVQGNYIGLNAAGTAVLPDLGYVGIGLGASSNNTIGGTTPSARNVISGWYESEIMLDKYTPLSTGDVVEGNYIGTNADGSAYFSKAIADGIELAVNSIISGNVVEGCGGGGVQGPLAQGGQVMSQGGQVTDNIIAFNGSGGVLTPSNGIQIKGNKIHDNGGVGVSVEGTGEQIEGNSIYGNNGPGIAVGGTGNQIEGNSIYSNTGPGVWVESDPFASAHPFGPFPDPFGAGLATGISIRSNSIYGNGGLGIALGNTAVDANGNPLTLAQVQANPSSWVNNIPNGVVLNDSLGHVGANNFQDFPVLTSAVVSGSNVTVTGTLNTTSGTAPFTVDVYANTTPDPHKDVNGVSGYGQGQYYLGNAPVKTDGSFSGSFSTASLPAALLASPWYISTTATDHPGNNQPGNTSEFSKDVCIPVASVTGPSDGVPGQPRTFTLSANASAVDQPSGFTYVVDWGDGTPQAPDIQTIPPTAGNGAGVAVDHVYTTPGTYTVSVTARDADNGTSSAVSQAISVQQVVMEGNSLAVGGTLGNDTITLTPADTTGDITVNLNGTTSFNGVTTFNPTDHILVYGQSGNDTIKLASTKIAGTTYYITVLAFIYGGGTGHEIFSVAGSTANNVVIGGGGTNQITGGLGRDLLIAGPGASKLYAGSAGAILIGGSTDYDLTSTAMTYDKKLAALEAIMTEWGSVDSYTTRVNDLTNGGGLNRSYLLNTSTVHDNGQADTLFGFPAATPLDWFFAGASDTIKHKNSGEMTTTIQ